MSQGTILPSRVPQSPLNAHSPAVAWQVQDCVVASTLKHLKCFKFWRAGIEMGTLGLQSKQKPTTMWWWMSLIFLKTIKMKVKALCVGWPCSVALTCVSSCEPVCCVRVAWSLESILRFPYPLRFLAWLSVQRLSLTCVSFFCMHIWWLSLAPTCHLGNSGLLLCSFPCTNFFLLQ